MDACMDRCANCGNCEDGSIILKTCTGCKRVKYCNIDCQKNHRSVHKKQCKKYKLFVFWGTGGAPENVIRVQVHSSVTVIPENTFAGLFKLEEVDLPEGLVEIGECAFWDCPNLKHIKIPSTVRRIGSQAFSSSMMSDAGKFTRLRIPPLVSSIPNRGFRYSKCMFSVELSEDVSNIAEFAFSDCHSLRNVALPVSAEVGYCTFFCCPALRLIDGVSDYGLMTQMEAENQQVQIIYALKHRFDKLPIHKMIYYQSYNNVTAGCLLEACDPTGNQRDCLGMTPLHILACSAVQNIELYRVLIEKYPESLVTEDRWGALPLLYAVWGSAPKDIMQFLIDSYQTFYPDYELNWTLMVDSLLSGLQEEAVYLLLDVQQKFFPNQLIDWKDLLDKAVTLPSEANNYRQTDLESFRIMVRCSIAERVDAIGLRQWRNEITDDIRAFHDQSHPSSKINLAQSMRRSYFIPQIKTKLSQFESEYAELKESILLLELALWKKRMREYASDQNEGNNLNQSMDRLGLDEEETSREKCRISCGSDIVIEHVLPFLVPIQR